MARFISRVKTFVCLEIVMYNVLLKIITISTENMMEGSKKLEIFMQYNGFLIEPVVIFEGIILVVYD